MVQLHTPIQFVQLLYWVQASPVLQAVPKLFLINELLAKHKYNNYEQISPELKKLIFNYFQKFAGGILSNEHVPTALWRRRGSIALNENACLPLIWATEVEFDQSVLDQSVLNRHIAIDLCYYLENHIDDGSTSRSMEYKQSKQLSDYMLHLLVVCPFMLPIGVGMIWFRYMCWRQSFFTYRNMAIACTKMLIVNTEIEPAKLKGDRSKSLLFDACILAKSLHNRRRRCLPNKVAQSLLLACFQKQEVELYVCYYCA